MKLHWFTGNGEDSSFKGAQFCRGRRAHSKIGDLTMKGGQTASKTAKNWTTGKTFKRLRVAHHSQSGAGTSGVWLSVASLPWRLVRVAVQRERERELCWGGRMGEREMTLSNWPPCHLKKFGDKACHMAASHWSKMDLNYPKILKMAPILFYFHFDPQIF